MSKWLVKKAEKYTSHDTQNEMVELMGQTILHHVMDSGCKFIL